MESPEFPPNSEASRRVEEKNVTRVTTSEPRRKRKSLRKQFKETLIGGDTKSTVRYVMFDVLLPAARDMIVDAGAEGLSKLIYGDSRRFRRPSLTDYHPTGNIQYNRYTTPQHRMNSPQRAMSRQARARHDFDEILLDSRAEAEQVIDRLFDLVSRYDTATVADLYELVGLASTHTDNKWGWTDIRGAGVTRARDGYVLDLPEPVPLA